MQAMAGPETYQGQGSLIIFIIQTAFVDGDC